MPRTTRLFTLCAAAAVVFGIASTAVGSPLSQGGDPRDLVSVSAADGPSALFVRLEKPLGRPLRATRRERLTILTSLQARRVRLWVVDAAGKRRLTRPVDAKRAGRSGRDWRYRLPVLKGSSYRLRGAISYVRGGLVRYHVQLNLTR